MTALQLENLERRYGDVAAVDGVSLQLEPGELFAMIGPSGCGKTTLLRMVCGLETPDAGKIVVDGKEVTDRPPEKRGMAMVFQNFALFAHLDAARNVAFGLGYAGVPRSDRARVALEHLDRVGMADLAHRRPAELSGGQQQRVALARALAVNPKILLLDEPLSNLDARLRETTRMEIRKLLREHGVTALYVTHDQEEAMAMADRIGVMRDGKLEQVGTPEEVYRRPVSAFVARFVARANVIELGTGPLAEQEADGVSAKEASVSPADSPPALVAIRPESIELVEEGAAAEIVERAFLGASTSFRLACEDGTMLEGQSGAEHTVPEVGTRVCYRVRPGGAVMVRP